MDEIVAKDPCGMSPSALCIAAPGSTRGRKCMVIVILSRSYMVIIIIWYVYILVTHSSVVAV